MAVACSVHPVRAAWQELSPIAPTLLRSLTIDRMAHPARIMYVELKSGFSDDGPAWIGRVRFSKTGRTIYYRGLTLRRRQGVTGNHVDVQTGNEYWVSGVKHDGSNRHPAGGRGPIHVDEDVAEEYQSILKPAGKKS